LKKKIPDSLVVPGHRDHNLLSALADEIRKRAGGTEELEHKFAHMLRRCVDDVIMTPKTGRRSYDELEKTEKTYIGTRVEIELRAMLGLPKGKLDTLILGQDVDIKNTMGNTWMIPTEAVDHPCILVAADEERAVCYLGLFVARLDNLTAGKNKDAKRSVSSAGFENILWLLKEHPYPSNFWHLVPRETIDRIFSGKSGNARMAALFREVQEIPITRDVVEAVAQQKDFMRRIRSDNGRGTRDILAREGILLLSGDYDADLIGKLSLEPCVGSEFISYEPKTENEVATASEHGIAVVWSTN
jgi:hypothetical protein